MRDRSKMTSFALHVVGLLLTLWALHQVSHRALRSPMNTLVLTAMLFTLSWYLWALSYHVEAFVRRRFKR